MSVTTFLYDVFGVTVLKKLRVLFHGSSIKVDVLQPHQAEDGMSEAGRYYGVYATDLRDAAIAFALGAVPDEAGAVSRVIGKHDLNPVKMVFVRGHPNFGGKGYLYELDPSGFKKVSSTQWVCDREITPIKVIEINVDDYLHLFRYASEEEKRAIELEICKRTAIE